MTPRETRETRIRARLSEIAKAFDAAKNSDDWASAHKLQLELYRLLDHEIREHLGARIEAEALATELLVYRPTRGGKPPAPPLEGYAYVHTAKWPWVCVAVELRQVVAIPGIGMTLGYTQEHYVPERKTICGKQTAYPVSERFPSGGWPRLHELCPDCTQILAKRGLLATDGQAADPLSLADLAKPVSLPGQRTLFDAMEPTSQGGAA